MQQHELAWCAERPAHLQPAADFGGVVGARVADNVASGGVGRLRGPDVRRRHVAHVAVRVAAAGLALQPAL